MKPVPKQNIKNKTKLKEDKAGFVISDLKAYLILAIICFVSYGNTIRNEYSLDDNFEITDYVKKGIAGIPDILTHHYVETDKMVFDYRPIAGITFAIEHQILGSNPHFSHFINILLYIVCVLLILRILNDIFQIGKIHAALPLLISAFYAVHPSHTEVVCSIKNREELLSMLFALLTLIYAHRFFVLPINKLRNAGVALLALLLSLTSKFVSLPIVPIIFLMGLYFESYKEKKSFLIFNSLLIFVAIGLALPNLLMYQENREMFFLENPLVMNHDIMIRIGTSCQSLLFYFKFLFYPFPFRFYYGYNMIPVVSLTDPSALFSFLLHLVLFIYGSFLLFKKEVTGFFIISYFICIFPFSNLIINYTGIVSERALFLPGVWFITAFFLLAFKWLKIDGISRSWSVAQKFFTAISVLMFVFYTWLTVQRNFDWKDEVTLLNSDIGNLKTSTLANYFYAWILEQEADKSKKSADKRNYQDQAIKYYQHALEISPYYSEPYFRLGKIYAYQLNQPDLAFDNFYKAYNLDSGKTTFQFQLARSYYLKNNFTESDKLFTDLYGKLPTDTLTLFFWSQVKYFKGDTVSALSVNSKLMKLAPQSWYAYVNRAYFYKLQGKNDLAMIFYEKAVKFGCRDFDIINLMIQYYNEKGETEKSSELKRTTGL